MNNKAILALLTAFIVSSMAAYAAAPVLTSIVGGAKEKEPFTNNLVGYWDMDKWDRHFVNDSTDNNNDGTVFGANRSNGKLGYGMVFDGVDDYVKVPDSNSLDASTAVTVSCWVKRASSAAHAELKQICHKTNSYGIYFGSVASNNNYDKFSFQSVIVSDWKTATDTVDITDLNWHFVVGTYDGSQVKLYVDGQLKNSTSITGSIAVSTGTFDIGAGAAGGNAFNGIIDEVSVYNRTLTADEIANHYSREMGTGNITTQNPLAVSVNSSSDVDNDILYTAVDWYKNGILNATTGHPNHNNSVLFMPFDARNTTGKTEDYSVMGNDGTIVGAIFTNDSAVGLGAMEFDGVNDYITLGNPYSVNITTGSMSVSAWVKINPSANTYQYPLYKGGDASSVAGYAIYIRESDGATFFSISDGSGNPYQASPSAGNIRDNTWHHIVGVLDRENARLRIYKDGAEVGTGTDISAYTNPINSTTNLFIGSQSTGSYPINGIIDEVRIYNRTLTANEIRQHYQATKLKGLTLNQSETKKNEKWNATVTLYDNSTGISTPMNFSFGTIVSCGYLAAEGNWNIDGEDGCALDDNYNLGNNNVSVIGEGTFRFNGYNITNYGTIVMRGTSAANRLTVTCDNGGCFKD